VWAEQGSLGSVHVNLRGSHSLSLSHTLASCGHKQVSSNQKIHSFFVVLVLANSSKAQQLFILYVLDFWLKMVRVLGNWGYFKSVVMCVPIVMKIWAVG